MIISNKVIMFVLFISLTLSFVGCECSKTEENKASTVTASPSVEQRKDSIREDGIKSDNLYVMRLQSVKLSEQSLKKAEKSFPAKLSKTYVYIIVAVDGHIMWVSRKVRIIPNQYHFEWPNDVTSNFAIPWNTDTRINIQVFATDDVVDASLTSGAIGTAGGAGIGATIGAVFGAVAIGAPTAGSGAAPGAVLGAKIGAMIGAAIGATGGAAAGGLTAKDQIVIEKEFDESSSFPLNERVKVTSDDGAGNEYTSEIIFKQTKVLSPIEKGKLKTSNRYLVRLKEIYLSSHALEKAGKIKDDDRYYVILRYGKEKYPFCKDKENNLIIYPDRSLNPQIYTIFNNTGDETEILIYKNNRIFDDVIFSSKVLKLQGTSWVFQGKVPGSDLKDQVSYVVLETFGPIQ